jgi:hypothetical protein
MEGWQANLRSPYQTAWPENLVITTPEERRPESAIKVSKANVATRTSLKT